MVDVSVLKKAKQKLYSHLVTVYEKVKTTDQITGISKFDWVKTAIENQPCKLSIKQVLSAEQGEVNSTISQDVKLFLDPEVEIKAGSKVEVLKDGVIYCFKSSGIARKYQSHQEIALVNEKDEA